MSEAVGRLAAWNYTTPTGIEEGYDSSDVEGRPYYLNLLPRWLTNETYPVRLRPVDLCRATASVTRYLPADTR